MRRICKSWYFQRIVTSLNINHQLAARGAELINSDLITRVEQMRAKETEVLRQIKEKMDRIKQKNLHQQSKHILDSDDHYIIIRSGDYYMFDDDTVDDVEPDGEPDDTDEMDSPPNVPNGLSLGSGGATTAPDVSSYDWREDRPTVLPIDIISAAITGGTKEALGIVEGRRSLTEMTRSFSLSPRETSVGQMSTLSADSALHIVTPRHDPGTPVAAGGSAPLIDIHQSSSAPAVPPPSPGTPGRTEVRRLDSAPAAVRYAAPVVTNGVGTEGGTGAGGGGGGGAVPVVLAEEMASEMIHDLSPDSYLDLDEADEMDKEQPGNKATCCSSLIAGLRVFYALILNTLDFIISQLYLISREYRSVSRRLELEREMAKRIDATSLHAAIATRSGEGHLKAADDDDVVDDGDRSDDDEDNDSRDMSSSRVSQIQRLNDSPRLSMHMSPDALRTADVDFHAGMPRPLRLVVAIGEALASNSDSLVYFTMILNVMMSANLLSIPYPCFIFFWALLSVPRPAKTYWVTMITYTEAVIVIKYLFQFTFFPWNESNKSEDDFGRMAAKFIGVERSNTYATLDFLVLFCLFMHRVVLKRHGLWKDAQDMSTDLDNVNKKLTCGHVLDKQISRTDRDSMALTSVVRTN